MAAKTQNGCRQCITISPLLLNYKVDTQVKIYYDEYIEIKCISFKLNENQDGRQISKCLPKTGRYNLSQVFMGTIVFRFSDTGMEVLGYMLAMYTALKVTALRFQFYLESKMAAKTKNGCRQCVELTIAISEQSREKLNVSVRNCIL